MTRRQLAYTALALALGFLVNIWLVVGYVDHVGSERDRAERQAAAERTQQQEHTRELVCKLAKGYIDAFRESPPAPDSAGAAIQTTWLAMATQFRCIP